MNTTLSKLYISAEAETVNQFDIPEFSLSIFQATVVQTSPFGQSLYVILSHSVN